MGSKERGRGWRLNILRYTSSDPASSKTHIIRVCKKYKEHLQINGNGIYHLEETRQSIGVKNL
jgi:hypothetical protein